MYNDNQGKTPQQIEFSETLALLLLAAAAILFFYFLITFINHVVYEI